jgi:MFS family permease
MTELGVISFAGSLGFAVFEPITGWLYDKIQIKRIIVFVSFVGIFIIPLYTIATELWHFALISFLISGANSGISSPTRAAIAHFVSESERGKAYGIFQSITQVGMMVGPVLGGYLAQNMNYDIPFYVGSFAIIGSLLAGLMLPKEERTKSRKDILAQPKGKEGSQYRTILKAGFVIFLAARALSVLVMFFSSNILIVYAKETLLATETQVGLISGLRSAVFAVMGVGFGMIANRIGKERLILLGMLMSAVSFLGFIVTQSLLQLYLVEAILGIGSAAFNLGLIVLLMDRTPSSHYGSAMGLYGLAEDVGGMVGSLAVGSLYDVGGFVIVSYFLSGVMVLDAFVSSISFRKFRAKNSPS